MSAFTFYGGVGEIGGNKVLLEDGDTRIWLDFGMSFAQMGCFFEEFLQPRSNAGVRDLLALGILPPVEGIYRQDLIELPEIELALSAIPDAPRDLWRCDLGSYDAYLDRHGRPFVDAVLVSHAHADHFQHLAYLDHRTPIVCSPITRLIMSAVSDLSGGSLEYEFCSVRRRHLNQARERSIFPGDWKIEKGDPLERNFQVIGDYEERCIGNLTVQGIPVDHSVPGAMAFLITTSEGTRILYTGDFRFHGIFAEATARFREKVAALQPEIIITEGTRINNDRADSEEFVYENGLDLARKTTGLLMVDFGWKDTTRFLTLWRVAREAGRTFVISAKLAYLLRLLWEYDPAHYPNPAEEDSIRIYLPRMGSLLYTRSDYTFTKYKAGYLTDWDKDQAQDEHFPGLSHWREGVRAYHIRQTPDRYLLMLSFWELNELLDIRPPADSCYIRAACEPFSDEMRLDEARLKAWLRHFNVNTQWDSAPFQNHASGHIGGPELCEFLRSVKPRVIVPIHTEHPDAFEDLAERVLRAEVGKRYALEPLLA
ncbi:MAG: hypothetical protein H5T64_05950 [Chloroflexi bacterium]|nr:hypothetical protein [Chloroflexota bacterium]